ncbi:hypothetical protein SHDE107825_01495 [Shewanella denitrificans]|jgi:hypothetical protein
MITLLSAPLPQAYSLLSASLPEVAALAFVLAITLAMALVLAALVVAMAGTVNSASARKLQNLTKPSLANRVIETPANRLAMPFTHRHAASTSMYARTSRPWDGRSSRKGSWFTLAAAVSPLNIQTLSMPGTVNSRIASQIPYIKSIIL